MTQDTTTPAPVPDMLEPLERFFRHYLHCSPEQRMVLQFWTLHTHCFAAAGATPYLFIHSPEKQSGKSLCLQLLNLLCADSWFSASVNPAVLVGKITAQRPTVLLDDCHTIFSPASRVRVCGMLMQGARRGGTFSLCRRNLIEDLDVFCPKALAGDFVLPAGITEYFIPIALLQNFDYGYFRRFHLQKARDKALPIVESLKTWAADHLDALKHAPPFPYHDDDFYNHFSPRQQYLLEPLLQIASILGGDWPSRLVSALDHIFCNDLLHRVYLLSDIRDLFEQEQVQRLPSREILAYLNALDERPWSEWNNGRPMKASDLAQMLCHWGIRVRNQRHDSGARGQGYDVKDFKDHFYGWLREHDARVNARLEGPLLLE